MMNDVSVGGVAKV